MNIPRQTPDNLHNPFQESPKDLILEKQKTVKEKINFLRQQAQIRAQKKKAEANMSSEFEDIKLDSKRSTPQWNTEVSSQKETDELQSIDGENNNLDTSFINYQDTETSGSVSGKEELKSEDNVNRAQDLENKTGVDSKILNSILIETCKEKANTDGSSKSEPNLINIAKINEISQPKNQQESLSGSSQSESLLEKSKKEEITIKESERDEGKYSRDSSSIQVQEKRQNLQVSKMGKAGAMSLTISDRLRYIEEFLDKILEKQVNIDQKVNTFERNQEDQAIILEEIQMILGR